MSLEITHNEDIINEIVPVSRGDDGLLEGAAIGDDLAALDVDSSDSDEEEGIVIHAGRTTSNRRPLYKSYATKQFQRTQLNSGREFSTPSKEVKPLSKEEEELKKLRFSRHLTAFDVDINTLEEHPWRNKNVDLLDYFNYGFNEKTWQQYCEKQLRIRAQKGLGPHQPPVAKVPVVPLASLVPASANLNLSTATAPPPQPSIQPTSQQQPPPQLTMPQNNQQSTMPAAPPGGLPSGSRPSTGMPLPPSWQHMPPPPMPPHLQQTGFQHMPPIMAPPMHPAGNWQGRMPPQPWDVPVPSHQPFSQGGGDRQYEVHKERTERSKDVTRDSAGKSRDVSDGNCTSSDQEKPSRHTTDNRQERSRADSRERGDSRNRDSAVKKASESGRRKDSRERESGGIKTESKGTTSSSGRDARRDSRDRERDREKKTLDRREDSSRGERRHESSSAGSRKSESSTKRHRDSRSRSRSKEHKRKR